MINFAGPQAEKWFGTAVGARIDPNVVMGYVYLSLYIYIYIYIHVYIEREVYNTYIYIYIIERERKRERERYVYIYIYICIYIHNSMLYYIISNVVMGAERQAPAPNV